MTDMELAEEIERRLGELEITINKATNFRAFGDQFNERLWPTWQEAQVEEERCRREFRLLTKIIAALRRADLKERTRVEDELKAKITKLEETRATLKSQMDDWLAENHKTLAARDNAVARADEAMVRIAELEKDAARLDWLHSELKLTIAHALHWPVTPQDTVSFRAKIDAALKGRA